MKKFFLVLLVAAAMLVPFAAGAQPVTHSGLTGANLHQAYHFEQPTDPGAVGAGKWWYRTDTKQLFRRNATDTGWDTVLFDDGAPAGANTQVQFNDNSSLGGDAGLTYDKTLDKLTATGGFVGPLTGNVTGNASTATALAANGANCPAGQAAAGVDASGAAEGCFVAGGGGGGSSVLDLGDDGINESTGIAEIATTGDTNNIFTEPLPDKLLIDLTKKWPASATTDALAANGANCSAGSAPLGVDASGAVEGCFDVATQAELDTHANTTTVHGSTSLNTAGSIVQRDLSGNFAAGIITATLSGNALTSTALATNGTNCLAGQAAQGVDSSGNAEGCFTPSGSGGSSVVLDLGDDNINESTSLLEIAVTGDTNAIFAEPLADKLLIDVSKKWPASGTADSATALTVNPSDCAVGSGARGITAAGIAEGCTNFMEEPAGNGIVVRTGANAAINRSVTSGTSDLVVTNGDGVAGNPTLNLSANVARNTPTDDNLMIGDGTAWQNKLLPNCADTAGQHLNYATATNSWSCGTSSTGGISGLTVGTLPKAATSTSIADSAVSESLNDVNFSKNIKLGGCTINCLTLDPSAITGAKTLTYPNATDTLVGRSTTDTLTNKTFDAEAAGNNLTTLSSISMDTASCNNTTAAPAFDLPTSGAPTPTCFGTTTTFGTLTFPDGVTSTASRHFRLPPGWTGAVDVNLMYFANLASTNASRLQVELGCVANSEVVNTGPTYNTASAINAGYTGVANQRNTVGFNNISATNCAAGESAWLRVSRIGADAGDTLAAAIELFEVELRLRRTQ